MLQSDRMTRRRIAPVLARSAAVITGCIAIAACTSNQLSAPASTTARTGSPSESAAARSAPIGDSPTISEAIANAHGVIYYRCYEGNPVQTSSSTTSPEASTETTTTLRPRSSTNGVSGYAIAFYSWDSGSGRETQLANYELPKQYRDDSGVTLNVVPSVNCQRAYQSSSPGLVAQEYTGGGPNLVGDVNHFTAISSDFHSLLVTLSGYSDGGSHIASFSLDDQSIRDLTLKHATSGTFASAPKESDPEFVGGGPEIRFKTNGSGTAGAPASGGTLVARTSMDMPDKVEFLSDGHNGDVVIDNRTSQGDEHFGFVTAKPTEYIRATSAAPRLPKGFSSNPGGTLAVAKCRRGASGDGLCALRIAGEPAFREAAAFQTISPDLCFGSCPPPTYKTVLQTPEAQIWAAGAVDAIFGSSNPGRECSLAGPYLWVNDTTFVSVGDTNGPQLVTIDIDSADLSCHGLLPKTDRRNTSMFLDQGRSHLLFASTQGATSGMYQVDLQASNGGTPQPIPGVVPTGTILESRA